MCKILFIRNAKSAKGGKKVPLNQFVRDMMAKMSFAVAMLSMVLVRGAIDADEVKSLPGFAGDLPSKHYSGYLEVPGDMGSKFYHYWFVESEGAPKTDPVGLWLNGGPGSSSLIGFLTENGPFKTDDASLPADFTPCGCTGKEITECQGLGMTCQCGGSKNADGTELGMTCGHGHIGECTDTCPMKNATIPMPTLFHNEYGWQKLGSFIWLESPAGVGFSYCDYEPCTANDTSTSVDNHNVLKAFFKGFPEYASNDFYLTGESYAGIYIPTLAEQIMIDPANTINLKGMAVGNGCWGSKVGLCAFGNDMQRMQVQLLYW
jgi:hypothetical protein